MPVMGGSRRLEQLESCVFQQGSLRVAPNERLVSEGGKFSPTPVGGSQAPPPPTLWILKWAAKAASDHPEQIRG